MLDVLDYCINGISESKESSLFNLWQGVVCKMYRHTLLDTVQSLLEAGLAPRAAVLGGWPVQQVSIAEPAALRVRSLTSHRSVEPLAETDRRQTRGR